MLNQGIRTEVATRTYEAAPRRDAQYRRYILQSHVTKSNTQSLRIKNRVRLERCIGTAFEKGCFYPLHKKTLKSVLHSDLHIGLIELLHLLTKKSEFLLSTGPIAIVLDDPQATQSENQTMLTAALEQILATGYWIAVSQENPNQPLMPLVKRIKSTTELYARNGLLTTI